MCMRNTSADTVYRRSPYHSLYHPYLGHDAGAIGCLCQRSTLEEDRRSAMLPTPYFGRPHFPNPSSRVKIFEVPSPSMLPTPHFGRPHYSHSWRKMVSEAPSPSMLPTPPDFDRPRFPHRRLQTSPARKASEQGVAGLCVKGPEEDTIVIPSHLELIADSSSFCRTPGAPQGRKAFTQSGETSHAARIGLGLMVAGQSFLPVV